MILLVTVGSIVVAHHIQRITDFRKGIIHHRMLQDLVHKSKSGGHGLVDIAALSCRIGSLNVLHDTVHVVFNGEHDIDAVSNIPAMIQRSDLLRNLTSPGCPTNTAGFRDLVTNGVKDNAGMVIVFPDHSLHVPLPPLGEILGIIIICLVLEPDICKLIHNIEANLVTSAKHGRADWVVGRTNGIIASRFQLPCSAFLRIIICSRT